MYVSFVLENVLLIRDPVVQEVHLTVKANVKKVNKIWRRVVVTKIVLTKTHWRRDLVHLLIEVKRKDRKWVKSKKWTKCLTTPFHRKTTKKTKNGLQGDSNQLVNLKSILPQRLDVDLLIKGVSLDHPPQSQDTDHLIKGVSPDHLPQKVGVDHLIKGVSLDHPYLTDIADPLLQGDIDPDHCHQDIRTHHIIIDLVTILPPIMSVTKNMTQIPVWNDDL